MREKAAVYARYSSHSQTEQSIEKELENITRSISNLVASVESGMPFDLIKDRLEELQEDKRKKKSP